MEGVKILKWSSRLWENNYASEMWNLSAVFIFLVRTKWLFFSRWLAKATITTYHRLGGLNNKFIFSQYTGQGAKAESKVSAGVVSSEVLLLGLDGCHLPVSSHGLPTAPVSMFSPARTPQSYWTRSSPWSFSLWLSYFFDDPVSKHNHILRN